MNRSSSPRVRAWLKLGGAAAAIAGLVALLHAVSPHAPGAAGRAYDNNTERDIDARALFYTEVGAVSEFLDEDGGRYGAHGAKSEFACKSGPNLPSCRPPLLRAAPRR